MSELFRKIKLFFGFAKVEPPCSGPEEIARSEAVGKVMNGVPVEGRRKIELFIDSDMLAAAKEICDIVETHDPQASGEAKHAMAYARMQRRFPRVDRRDIALAIELGLRS